MVPHPVIARTECHCKCKEVSLALSAKEEGIRYSNEPACVTKVKFTHAVSVERQLHKMAVLKSTIRENFSEVFLKEGVK